MDRTDELACVPPCPTAAGRMGLLCTCGNAPKRLHAIFDRLDAERDGALGNADLCHNGHPFEPGLDADALDEPGDPRWCDVCGEARRSTPKNAESPVSAAGLRDLKERQ